MRAGNLKHKIIIQSYTETKNDFGEVVKGWADFKQAYSSITPVSAKEFFKAGINAEVSHKVSLRFISGITPKMRVLYGYREFSIEGVINVREENKVLNLFCTEVV